MVEGHNGCKEAPQSYTAVWPEGAGAAIGAALSGSSIGRPATTNIDLKSLIIMNELHRTRSVSQAAENLRVSQSSISMSLAKLRRQFNDPLFVRTSTGMEPTPHALEVLTLLSKAERLIQSALQHQVIFDATTSERIFHICSTDIAVLTLLPTLMRRLKEIAPSIQVDLLPMSDSIPRLLESGEVDLAVGFISPMGAGFYQQRLFRDRFVCAVRAGHPRVQDELTLQQFELETHLTVATPGTGHSVLERTLAAKKIRRKVGLRVPSFLGLAPILTNTDYLAVVPEQLGQSFASTGQIRLLQLPFAIAPYYILQHWHERYNHDPANVWFRSVMAELFLR
ncbi:MAG: LysR family transcriptional regulator [Terriglobia bacterium]|nr:MAG: LysR family transcriptional regulator [Terriglobia bacterium]